MDIAIAKIDSTVVIGSLLETILVTVGQGAILIEKGQPEILLEFLQLIFVGVIDTGQLSNKLKNQIRRNV